MYKYFVSFVYKKHSDHYVCGFGNTEVTTDIKIESINDVTKIARKIEVDEKLPKNSIVVINYKLFED